MMVVVIAFACDALQLGASSHRYAVGRFVRPFRSVDARPLTPTLTRATETEGEVFEILEDVEAEVSSVSSISAADDDDGEDETQQARVVSYMVLSLLPILALLPFFGSRTWLPADIDPSMLN